jgi:Pentapeptide repeats (8 copies)
MAAETHPTRLWQGMAAWTQWRKGRGSVLRQRCASAFQRAWGAAAPAGRQGLQMIKDTGRKTVTRLRAMPWQALARRHWKLLLLIGAVVMVGIIWKVPQWQAAGWQGQMETKDLAKLQNDARTTLVQALGGAVLLIGLYFTLRNLQLTEDRQITERYTRAIEQLGSDKLELRLGAIYALERIARDSERDHWPIMEILTTYVREHAPWNEPEQHSNEGSLTETPPTQNPEPRPKPTTDVQAILTVLGRRTRSYGKGEEGPLILTRTDLRGANLSVAHLERAFFSGAHLERAFLIEARLKRASFSSANLEFARLIRAHLEGARFTRAHLLGASLRGAHLRGADFGDANLQWANFEGATDLTVEQLAEAKTLYQAELDPPLLEQVQQRYPHLLEEPRD